MSVYLFDDGQEVDIPASFITPVPPVKNDKVRKRERGGEERV